MQSMPPNLHDLLQETFFSSFNVHQNATENYFFDILGW